MTRLGIGLIGVGSIGLRMLRSANVHARVRPVVAFDPDTPKLQRALRDFPQVRAARSAQEIIDHDAVDVVYVASPPMTHADHAHAALEVTKPVLCEKPLGVDEATSRELVAHAQRSDVANAVNFIHASDAGTRLVAAVKGGELGQVRCAELRIHARQWAEHRYAEAPWLQMNDEGGLVREVLSHFVFLSQRLFGPARVVHCQLRAPPDVANGAETQVLAHLVCGDVPVLMLGNTEGAGPDVSEYIVWGERASRCVAGLYQLRGSDGGAWRNLDADDEDPAARWFRSQLDNVADWAVGRPHTLPDFAEAFSVQQVIEQMTGR